MKDKHSIIKWLIFAALVVASAVVITPPKDKIRLGLDLAGGTSFTVQIDEEQLREERKAAEPDKTDREIDAEIAAIMKNADERTVEVLRNRIDSLGVGDVQFLHIGKQPLMLRVLTGQQLHFVAQLPLAASNQYLHSSILSVLSFL